MAKVQNLEKQTQNAIIREFGTRTDMRLWRANSGVAHMGKGRTVRFGVPGQADLSGILAGGRRLEIEVKSPTGRQSDDQKNYQAMIERFGGVYILAQNTQDVWDGLQAAGWKRKYNQAWLCTPQGERINENE